MNPNWNERYGVKAFAYGKTPNVFFKEWLEKFEPRSILMPADGEGRNGVFAAQLGWQVTSFDLSKEGKAKALELAAEKNTSLEYLVDNFEKIKFDHNSFDAIGLIYAHFPADKKSNFHKRLVEYLRPTGIVIFEAFSKNHLDLRKRNAKVGGPLDINMLFSKEEILKDFENFEVLMLEEEEVVLEEGKYHNGKSSVIRFVGRKLSFKQ